MFSTWSNTNTVLRFWDSVIKFIVYDIPERNCPNIFSSNICRLKFALSMTQRSIFFIIFVSQGPFTSLNDMVGMLNFGRRNASNTRILPQFSVSLLAFIGTKAIFQVIVRHSKHSFYSLEDHSVEFGNDIPGLFWSSYKIIDGSTVHGNELHLPLENWD